MTMKRPISILLALLIAGPIAHAQQRLSEPRAHGNVSQASAEAPGQSVPAAAPESGTEVASEVPAVGAPVGENYVIGPGDTIQVFVWRNPDLTITLPVRPDGKITTRLVEDMVAVGKTPSNLARDIETALAEYIRSPQVNIIVTQPRSAFSQIKVIGEVGQPQSLAYREGLTVLDVILAVGGLGDFAAGNRAHILRSVGGKEEKIPVRLNDLYKGDRKYDLPMVAGDILVVPKSRF